MFVKIIYQSRSCEFDKTHTECAHVKINTLWYNLIVLKFMQQRSILIKKTIIFSLD